MKNIRRSKTFVLCTALLAAAIIGSMLWMFESKAYEEKTGIVKVESVLNVREGPGTSYGVLIKLSGGASVQVIGEANASDGALWYKIRYGATEGYVSAAYVQVISGAQSADFEQYLEEQGFPESYKAKLRELHNQYPNWKFVAQHINMSWDYVLEQESVVGRNLVPRSSQDSWKSLADGAYNWNTDTWYGLDGNSWVAASKEIIAYYLDPRNFLNGSGIFQFETLKRASYQTEAGVSNIIANTFMIYSYNAPEKGGRYGYAPTFMEAADITGVSPYHLASRVVQEVSKPNLGYSDIVSGEVPGYVGYFNYFNINAYANSSGTALQNGLKYAMQTDEATMRPWNTSYRAIIGGSIFVGNQYVNKGQDTIYLEKFNVTNSASGLFYHQYMTNIQAAWSESTKVAKAYNQEMYNAELIFYIPVYQNMPAEACAMPTGTGSPNNLLASLSIDGYSLTPTFAPYQQEYELIVENSVTSVNVNAKAVASGATVSGAGTYHLNEGNNTFVISVTAKTGAVRTYEITIFRKTSGSTVDPSKPPQITSSVYEVSSIITKVAENTPVETVLANISSASGTVQVLNPDGSVRSGNVGTGTIVRVYKDNAYTDYPIVIYGDVSGDGKITNLDVVMIRRYILNLQDLSGAYLMAADPNKDGRSIGNLDIITLRRHVLGIQEVNQ